MRQVILASHHKFAQGLADTLEFLGAKCDFHVICAYVDDTPLEPQVETVFDAISPDDEVLVLTDILAGSVNQKFLPYVAPNVFVVAGVNVVLAMELCLAPAPLTAEGIQNAIDMAGQSIKLLNTIQVEDDEDDE
ncbi:PTS N-acetylglucosamine transporter subunit IIBC [Collinsella sp. AM24-1]|uniref:PTS sugar transporter subunit IIA n=1 Tax=unclassified Collinsella TaxID=2637548 RepID=UPI000E4C43C6|nr:MULTISPECIES: PTS N-acetylglucosamine transporter subunit IIBC [unclassified Collinsella]RGT02686.1 PTS N-acetylglucosamine transporter subunit IIBC [Collinsella sp. AF19-7AC]RGT29869.1 PTS N-acetylglucosamine transporter subunit IIBC [Collinsella sp. AF19-1LB]RHA71585.1 PTS N-acetylglucosamine transporter subunit IIBC [Collinsella sp. AM43-1]RHE26707.1 PTS N-acetylglucosamine transporter subunit IIBC [Collinsella sp. AM29-10AC]RHF73092.1 PTS N-acetylglucosamine transporter subunit IIBC [Co